MPINSPIANFTEVLKRVKTDAERYEDLLSNNEAQTRLTLIDPILRGLGWDLSNPRMVKVELVHNQTRLDYGLLASDYEIRVVVEAKKLGTDLDNRQNYNIAILYAFANNIPHVVLTDGVNWHFYDDFSPGRRNPTTFNFRDGSLNEIAQALINRLDAANFGYCLTENLHEAPTVDIPAPGDLIQEETLQQGDFLQFERLPANLTGHRPPTALRLPDRSVILTNHWADVLFETSKYVLDRVTNLRLPLLDQSNGTVYLISLTETTNRNKQYSYRRQPIYINLNYSANNCIKNSKYILEKLPANLRPNPIALKFN